MRAFKKLMVVGAIGAAAIAAPLAQAGIGDTYSSVFQGLTFTFNQTDADSLTFRIQGTPAGDWAGVNYLGAFAFKDLGLDFTTVTGTANGPGATNLLGLNSDLSASNVDCSKTTGQAGTICFDVVPDVAIAPLPMDFLYTVDFSSNLAIKSSGVHLKIAFMNVEGGSKIGSLYSQDVGLSSSSTSGGATSGGATSGNQTPEPASAALVGLALGLIGYGHIARRRRLAKR